MKATDEIGKAAEGNSWMVMREIEEFLEKARCPACASYARHRTTACDQTHTHRNYGGETTESLGVHFDRQCLICGYPWIEYLKDRYVSSEFVSLDVVQVEVPELLDSVA